MKTLGLIGGITWLSTVEYYRGLNEVVSRRAGGTHYPKLAMYSLDFGEVRAYTQRNDWDGFLELAWGVARHLRDAGAQGLLLCANTAHIVADRLQARIGLPVINIVDATARAINAAGVDTVALLGTRFTMEMDFFRERLEENGVTALIPEEDDRAFIHASIFDELSRGEFRPETKQRYLRIIEGLRARGVAGVILGCTEIPLIVKPADVALPLFDTTLIHVDAAADFILAD